MNCLLAVVSQGDIALFILALLAVLIGLLFFFFTSFWRGRRQDVSPYTGMPLRYTIEIPYATRDKVNAYLRDLNDYDNSMIDWEKAAFCRETGRIFPFCVTWSGNIKLDWSFISKRYRGNFVSWGSLSDQLKKEVLKAQGALVGFQTGESSKNPAPRMVEDVFAYTKPGPLYVDPETKIVIGWKEVPETAFEVLLVKKPMVIHLLNIEQK